MRQEATHDAKTLKTHRNNPCQQGLIIFVSQLLIVRLIENRNKSSEPLAEMEENQVSC